MHDVEATGHDDEAKDEDAQTFGIELKPETGKAHGITDIVPKESEEAESPDTTSGQPEPVEAPPTVDPSPPPRVSPNTFGYTHGPTIPNYVPERRSDWRRPDGWIPTDWSGVCIRNS